MSPGAGCGIEAAEVKEGLARRRDAEILVAQGIGIGGVVLQADDRPEIDTTLRVFHECADISADEVVRGPPPSDQGRQAVR